MDIKKVVVIGSGTMGSGIAAHLCNANVPVTLLDLTTEISEKARERIKKSRPPLLIDKSKIDNINVGNINDDFKVVNEADWIVEAAVVVSIAAAGALWRSAPHFGRCRPALAGGKSLLATANGGLLRGRRGATGICCPTGHAPAKHVENI